MVRHVVHPDWLAAVATWCWSSRSPTSCCAGRRRARAADPAVQFVGTLDRSVGLAIGLARPDRAGRLNLMFNAATPKDLQPHWITGATTWPLRRTWAGC
jgi:membrane protein required for colicin V production